RHGPPRRPGLNNRIDGAHAPDNNTPLAPARAPLPSPTPVRGIDIGWFHCRPGDLTRSASGRSVLARLPRLCRAVPFAEYPRMALRTHVCLLGCGAVLLFACPRPAHPAGPAEADRLLKNAEQAYGQKNFPQAVAGFREVIAKYGKTPSGPAARFGLAVCLIEGPDRNPAEALKLLEGLEGPDAVQVLYQRGAALRGLAVTELALAASKAKDAAKHRAAAEGNFERAAEAFAKARAEFTRRAGPWADRAQDPPDDAEWAARAACDAAEAGLRLGRYRQVADDTQV